MKGEKRRDWKNNINIIYFGMQKRLKKSGIMIFSHIGITTGIIKTKSQRKKVILGVELKVYVVVFLKELMNLSWMKIIDIDQDF